MLPHLNLLHTTRIFALSSFCHTHCLRQHFICSIFQSYECLVFPPGLLRPHSYSVLSQRRLVSRRCLLAGTVQEFRALALKKYLFCTHPAMKSTRRNRLHLLLPPPPHKRIYQLHYLQAGRLRVEYPTIITLPSLSANVRFLRYMKETIPLSMSRPS